MFQDSVLYSKEERDMWYKVRMANVSNLPGIVPMVTVRTFVSLGLVSVQMVLHFWMCIASIWALVTHVLGCSFRITPV